MKGLLLNDTSLVEENPGCQITCAELKKLYTRRNIKLDSKPLGFLYNVFRNYTQAPKLYSKSKFLTRRFDKKQWKKNCNRASEQLSFDYDFVLINGEGTIHSNQDGCVTLLSMASIYKSRGIKVYLVNATLYNLNDFWLQVLKTSVDRIVVREKDSFEYLKRNGLTNVRQGADCVFLMDKSKRKEEASGKKLYTPGVLYQTGKEKLNPDFLQNDFECLAIDRDEQIKLQKDTHQIVHLLEDPNSILSFLSQYDAVISGRYHILLFCLMVGVPVQALGTNTYKIEGVLKLLGETAQGLLTVSKEKIEMMELLAQKNYVLD